MEEWVNLIVAILSGLATAIPLVIQLVKYVRQVSREKNWSSLVQLVLKLMVEAEQNYSTGAERKEYVIDTIKAMEGTLNYDVDEHTVAAIVDSIVEASKTINTK